MNWKLRSTVVPMVAATGLVVALGAGTAFADEATTVDALSTDGYVTAAATRAAQPAPEILGLSGIEETGNMVDSLDKLLDWSSPKYYLMATTTYNINPNPFFYNYIYNTSGAKSIVNPSRCGIQGPRAALGTYGEDATDDDVWNALPDVVIGTMIKGGNADYNSAAYAGAISAAKGISYNPIGVDYRMTVNSEYIDTMYDIAKAADSVVASNPTKKLRYGNATDIAADYEAYIRGTQGYVLSQLEADGASKKVVASVSSYDPTTKTYKIIDSGYAEGTASTNRYLEACESVSVNLVDKLDLAKDENGLASCTAEQLAEADLLLIGCQDKNDKNTENLVSVSDILNTMTDEEKAKSFYVVDKNGSAGSMYGVVMNSPENAQNIGRILGCLYPEYVDQDDWICYYYDNFYHIKADKLAEAIDNAMDGVRNWDSSSTSTEAAATDWTTADAATYNEAAVQSKIDSGIEYLKGLGEDAGKILTPSETLANRSTSIASSDVTVGSIAAQTYTGKEIKPGVEVTCDGKELVEGTDYKITYANNVKQGTATATVNGIGAYRGSVEVSFKIEGASYTNLWGNVGWQTAVKISEETFAENSCKTAVLVRDDDFRDAMSATGLAGAYECPLLLINRESGVYDEVKAELKRLGVEHVFVIGGEGAIPADIKSQLSDLKVERVFGASAPMTSIECAKKIAEKTGKTAEYAVVARSDNFRDALSMSSFAYSSCTPIFLEHGGATADDRELPAEALEYLNSAKKVFITGGTAAISDKSVSGVTAEKTRLWGETGYETSNEIAKYMVENNLLSADTVVFANGSDRAGGRDALAGAALAGINGGVMLLTNGGGGEYGDPNTSTITGFLTDNVSSVKDVYALGGSAVINDSIATQIQQVIGLK